MKRSCPLGTSLGVAAAALALASVLAPGCGSSVKDTILISLHSDGPVDQYDLYIYDDTSKKNLLHTGWSDATKGGTRDISTTPLTIGLSLLKADDTPMDGTFDIVIIGVKGNVEPAPSVRPASGAKQFFFGKIVTVSGGANVTIDAPLLHVPNDPAGDKAQNDDLDRDLYPDSTHWLQAVPAAVGVDDPKLLDCNDKTTVNGVTSDLVHPFAVENCSDGVDENCDGVIPTCVDTDGDGDPDCGAGQDPKTCDCKPMDPKIHHPQLKMGAHYDPYPEAPNCCGYSLGMTGPAANMPVADMKLCHAGTCGDGIDQDCDGMDTKCVNDGDCDTFPAMAPQNDGCGNPPNMPSGTDCDDCNAAIHPGAAEICDQKDNNCNGLVDETCVACDLDGDGYERSDGKNCPDNKNLHPGVIDCNDEDAGVYPGAISGTAGHSVIAALRRQCANVNPDGMPQDANCDKQTWEGCNTMQVMFMGKMVPCDADQDGYVNSALSMLCDPMGKGAPYDCNDDPMKDGAHVFPGAPDKCGDGIAQNCVADNPDCSLDKDKDGYIGKDDCNDDPGKGGADAHPWAVEKCNTADDDCDGLTDEGNPDATGKPMVDKGMVIHCTDSSVGLCQGPPVGDCVCSPSSVNNLHFDQANRNACPGENAQIDNMMMGAFARCYFAVQPAPQSCDPMKPQDDDCDGRIDAPDGVNFPPAQSMQNCWPAAVGQCKATLGGKITGCKQAAMGKSSNCYQAFGVNPWFTCDNTEVCPQTELCNGFDDDCDGKLPMNEQDVDKDGYIQCGSKFAGGGLGGVMYDNAQKCEKMLAPGVKGCGDCADASGMTGGVGNAQIFPTQPEQCNNLDDDCDPGTADGITQCANGGPTPNCCSAQKACRNLTKGDTGNCGTCSTGQPGDKSVCDPVRANACAGGGCVCAGQMAACMIHQWCDSGQNNGTCGDCNTDQHCGNSCVDCTKNAQAPHCKGDSTGCVGCNDDSTCNTNQYCLSNICTPKKAIGQSCAKDDECLGPNGPAGQCVDGLCCDTPLANCAGCKQCNLPASPGICKAVPRGQDPHHTCTANMANCLVGSCQGDATCNADVGISCGVNSCTPKDGPGAGSMGQTCQLVNGMMGTITCTTKTADCMGFTCDCKGGNCSNQPTSPYPACFVICISVPNGQDTNCDASHYCVGGNSCVPKLANGALCAAADQCTSGHCLVRQDGKTICAMPSSCGLCLVAAGDGSACVNASAASDPKGECTKNVAKCIDDNCDGNGTCNLPDNTVCANQSCTNGLPKATQVDNLCKSGTCKAINTSCADGLLCTGTQCRASCAADTDCDSTYFCISQSCSLKKANGQSCAGSNQCTSGNCQPTQNGPVAMGMGVCAPNNVLCSAACQVANPAGSACVAASAGSDPKGDCAANVANCQQGNCNGGTGTHACDVPNATPCAATTCANGTQSVKTCNNMGACITTTPSCGAYGCAPDMSSCNNACAGTGMNGNCNTGYCCQGMTCKDLTAAASCGSSCSDCTVSTAGHACVAGACGCSKVDNSECTGIMNKTKCLVASKICVQCLVQSDCAGAGNGLCTNNACAAPACNDNIKNGTETDVDCGGSCGANCLDGAVCSVIGDCKSNICSGGKCACGDGVKNNSESDVDCGGAICNALSKKCLDGAACGGVSDCKSGACNSSKCACGDGVKNNGETDTDCGGTVCLALAMPKRCTDGLGCGAGGDCKSGACRVNNTCDCGDTVKNNGESDVDCGGNNCSVKCKDNKGCTGGTDCMSGLCNGSSLCECGDGAKNVNETDVDCGGTFCDTNGKKCSDGLGCGADTDCTNAHCDTSYMINLCTGTPSCANGAKNNPETDVDCGGGTCPGCPNGKICAANSDCSSAHCDTTYSINLCTGTASCADGSKNNAETDKDCGGGTCPKCPDGQVCVGDTDCLNAHCDTTYSINLCTGTASCANGVKDNAETDKDCGGGTCPLCPAGKVCLLNSDCKNGTCNGGPPGVCN